MTEQSATDDGRLDPTDISAPLRFDLDSARSRMDGDERLLNVMLGFFASEVPTLMKRVDEALESGDAGAARQAAHAMKGHCMNFGVQPCGAAMQAVEGMAKSGDVAGAEVIWSAASTRVEEALEWVNKRLDSA